MKLILNINKTPHLRMNFEFRWMNGRDTPLANKT